MFNNTLVAASPYNTMCTAHNFHDERVLTVGNRPSFQILLLQGVRCPLCGDDL